MNVLNYVCGLLIEHVLNLQPYWLCWYYCVMVFFFMNDYGYASTIV